MPQQFLTYKVTKTSSCVTISLQLASQDSSLCKSLVVYYKFRDTFIIGIYIYIYNLLFDTSLLFFELTNSVLLHATSG